MIGQLKYGCVVVSTGYITIAYPLPQKFIKFEYSQDFVHLGSANREVVFWVVLHEYNELAPGSPMKRKF